MLKEMLTCSVETSELFRGFFVLNLLGSPLTILLTFYITIMGASNPAKPGFFNTLGLAILFIYGTQLAIVLWLISFGKIFDVILPFNSSGLGTVLWFNLILAAMTLVIAGNIFVDHLYQFKHGNYSISFWALLMTVGYLVVIYFAAKIPIKWI